MDIYIFLLTILLLIILLVVTISVKKQIENILLYELLMYKMGDTELKEINIKHCTYYYLEVVSCAFLLVCFVNLKESTCEAWKNVFISLRKLFLFQIIKF